MGTPAAPGETDRNGGNILAIQRDEVSDYRSLVEPLLPVSEASMLQLRPGPEPSNVSVFSSEKISILGVRVHAASTGVVILKPDCFSFMWWDGREECRINGEPTRRTLLHAQGEQDGFHATGGARRTMGIAVRRDDLIETLAALRGVGPEDVLLKRTALELSTKAADRFRTGIEALVGGEIERGPGEATGAKTADPSEAIFGLLLDTYLHAQPNRVRRDWTRSPEQIVRKAEERFFEAKGVAVSLADLCAATGVSQSALYRAFHAVCDEPPLAYFRKRRLNEVRRELIASSAYRGAIKRSALGAGLTELGRFSVEYRYLFGESPSATLNKK